MPHAWQGFGTLQIHRYMYTDISLQSLNIIVPIANSNQCELDRALIKIGITELGLWWYKRNKTLQEKISQCKNYSFDFQSLAVCYTYVTDKMSVCYGSPKLWIWIKKNNNKKSCGQGLGSQKIDNVNMKLFGKKFEKPLNYNSAAFLTHCSNRVSLVSLSSTGGSLASGNRMRNIQYIQFWIGITTVCIIIIQLHKHQCLSIISPRWTCPKPQTLFSIQVT